MHTGFEPVVTVLQTAVLTNLTNAPNMVGEVGVEPTASWSQTKPSTVGLLPDTNKKMEAYLYSNRNTPILMDNLCLCGLLVYIVFLLHTKYKQFQLLYF